MAVFNGSRRFAAKKHKSRPVYQIPKSVRQTLNVDREFSNGSFKIEPQPKGALYDRCYLFEDINYINKDAQEQRSFLVDLMTWLNAMNVDFKITLANEYQSMEEFLKRIRSEKNREEYPEIAQGIRQWQESRLDETNPQVTTMRYLTITARADNEMSARIYMDALEKTIAVSFAAWGSRIVKLGTEERLQVLHGLMRPGDVQGEKYISYPADARHSDWRNDILPRSIRQHKNFLVLGDTYVTVLYASRYKKSVNSDSLIRSLTNVSYPSLLTLDFTPVETEIIEDKLGSAQMNNERSISDEQEQKQKAGRAAGVSYYRVRKKQKIEGYIDRVDDNDEQGFFVNLLIAITAESEDQLAERMRHMQATARNENVTLETCDFMQLKAWNTVLPIGGRYVDYMRFFLSSSIVAFQPYHAQDIIEPGGQMMGLNLTTKHFIVGDRRRLKNPHAIIVGLSGTGKSMLIKLTELAQTLLATDDDIFIVDPQNEFADVCTRWGGAYFDLTPRSGVYLNGFEVTAEVFGADEKTRNEFVAAQTEYAKSFCAAVMKNIAVTQEHDSVISRCTERMFDKVFEQKKLKKQPTLVWLREELKEELKQTDNLHDEELVRSIYNSLAEYTEGSCDMLAHPSNIAFDSRLVGFGMSNVPENNWEAVMVTVLHYLSTRMNYNKLCQRATHLVVDESQVVSKKPGSAKQLNDAVLTFRKFGGEVTLAMQNVTAALNNQLLVELYANCAYKCFFDQGGVDAQALSKIQKFSTKEFQMLSSSGVGQGVMVWDKKVVLFDALIEKSNALYQAFNTNFHEQAQQKKDLL